MERNRNFVNNLLKDLRKTSRYLSEAYIFDEHEDGPDMEGMYDEYGEDEYDERRPPMQDPTMQGHHEHEHEDDSAEEQAMHAQEVIQHEPIIGKIRETAIEGLKKYSDNPTSKLYEFFKKVFLESDKVLTDTGTKK